MQEESDTASETQRSWLKRISRLFITEPKDRNELILLLRELERKSILDVETLSLIEGAMQVSEMQVREIMIPRSQMIIINADDQPETFLPQVLESAHSRFPVVGEKLDDVLGILLAKDLLALSQEALKNFVIKDVLRPATFIPESKPLNILLREFRNTRNHMAIVVDEYGGVAGLVTIEDVLEQIVGDIEDEHDYDSDDSYIKPIKSHLFHVNAITPLKEFNEQFNTAFSDDEFDTIGGVILQKFGRLPRRLEAITVDGIQYKVLHADNRRIRLLQIKTMI